MFHFEVCSLVMYFACCDQSMLEFLYMLAEFVWFEVIKDLCKCTDITQACLVHATTTKEE